MNPLVQRVKNLFKRNPRANPLPPGSFPTNSNARETIGTIPKPVYPTDDDDDDEDIESVGNYNVPEQTRLREQDRSTSREDESSQAGNPYGRRTPINRAQPNPSNTNFRIPPNNVTPRMPMNNTMNPPLNTNMGPNSNPPVRPVLPFLGQIQDPSIRATPNPPVTSTSNSQPSFGGFPPGMNLKQSTPTPPPPFASPSPIPVGPPPNVNTNFSSPNNLQTSGNTLQPPTSNNRIPSPSAPPQPQSSQIVNNQPTAFTQPFPINNSNANTNTQQRSVPNQMSAFRNRSNDEITGSRLELDYPIEDVLIDANIPSAMAFKINDAVEHDRYGNTHHVHRYTFEPSSQQTSYRNDHHQQRHSGKHSHRGATRHIREIHNNNHHRPHRHHHDDNNHQNSLFPDPVYPSITNKYHPEVYDHSGYSLNQYVDQLLHTPGSVVIQANGIADVHRILDQHLPMNPTMPTEFLSSPFQSNPSTITEPVFYYTARALPYDPMRTY